MKVPRGRLRQFGERRRLAALRRSSEYEPPFAEAEPLVTVVIPTYDNYRLLAERSIPSIQSQTYERWEALVVGDAAPHEAAVVVAGIGDPRISYWNRTLRGPYPEDTRTDPNTSSCCSAPLETGVSSSHTAWRTPTGPTAPSRRSSAAFRPNGGSFAFKRQSSTPDWLRSSHPTPPCSTSRGTGRCVSACWRRACVWGWSMRSCVTATHPRSGRDERARARSE
jgi:hypothetical protein